MANVQIGLRFKKLAVGILALLGVRATLPPAQALQVGSQSHESVGEFAPVIFEVVSANQFEHSASFLEALDYAMAANPLLDVASPVDAVTIEEVLAAPRTAQASPLAAQLAVQARMNVPAGRKPMVAGHKGRPSNLNKPKPVTTASVKKHSQPRSVFLQARHKAATPVRLPSNVVQLPVKSRAGAAPNRHVRIAA